MADLFFYLYFTFVYLIFSIKFVNNFGSGRSADTFYLAVLTKGHAFISGTR